MNRPSQEYFEKLEADLRQLLLQLSDLLTAEDRTEVEDKIDHREYGIALQALGACVLQNNVNLDHEARYLFSDLMGRMGMKEDQDEDHWFWEKMRSLVEKE